MMKQKNDSEKSAPPGPTMAVDRWELIGVLTWYDALLTQRVMSELALGMSRSEYSREAEAVLQNFRGKHGLPTPETLLHSGRRAE